MLAYQKGQNAAGVSGAEGCVSSAPPTFPWSNTWTSTYKENAQS